MQTKEKEAKTMLTKSEFNFKSMKSEIDLRSKFEYKEKNYLFISFVLNLLLLGEKVLPKIFPTDLFNADYTYPVYYSFITICMLFSLPFIHTMGKIKIKNYITGLCIAGSVIYIAITFGAGVLMKNLASSSYDTSLNGIVRNIVSYLPKTAAFIMVRSYSVNSVYKKTSHPYLWIVVITSYIAALGFNYVKLSIMRSYEDIFIFLFQDIVPKLSVSVLLTVICLTGGSIPCICYECIKKIFMFVFPFIPSLPWIAESVIGITYPITLSMYIWEKYKEFSRIKNIYQRDNVLSFILPLLFLVGVSWFVVGVFSIYPSVILTGSMEPVIFPGDIVLIKKLSSEEEIYKLKAGDIINFKMEDITITHRIEEVIKDEAGNLSFVTKGDNNDSRDSWIVGPNDLKGIVENIVPKIGIPVVYLYSNQNIPQGVIDY